MEDYLKRFTEPLVIETDEAAEVFLNALEEAENHKSTPEEIKERKRKSKELDKMMKDGERFLKSMWAPYKIFIISDTHFGHDNIIEYENRPFLNSFEMDNYMIEEWNKVVNHNDIVLHLGDFFLTHTKRQMETFNRLNGKVILIRGNHDKQSKTKLVERIGFKEVHDEMVLMYDDYIFILTHRPMDKDSQILSNEYVYNIHGHKHGVNEEISDKHKCVSAENFLLRPVKLERLVKLIKTRGTKNG